MVTAGLLSSTTWLSGPDFLLRPEQAQEQQPSFGLVSPESDVEVRSKVTTLSTQISDLLGSK